MVIRSLVLALGVVLAGGTLAVAGDNAPATNQPATNKAQEWLQKHAHKKHHHHCHHHHHHHKGQTATAPAQNAAAGQSK